MEVILMVNYPNYLSGSQDDINKRLLEMILKLQKGETSEGTDISALKTAVGDKDSGLVKAVADIQKEIGDKTDPASGTIWKAIDDLQPSG